MGSTHMYIIIPLQGTCHWSNAASELPGWQALRQAGRVHLCNLHHFFSPISHRRKDATLSQCFTLIVWHCGLYSFNYLESSIRILKEKWNRSIINVLTTPQLAWLCLRAGRKGRIIEYSHVCVALMATMTCLLMRLQEEARILYINYS